jgi:hypothetical protein
LKVTNPEFFEAAMKKPFLKIAGVIALCAFSSVARAEYYDTPEDIDVMGPYTQAASGMLFPERVLDFERTGVARYNSEGTEESVDYVLDEAGRQAAITVYVYPAPVEILGALAGNLSGDELADALYMVSEQLFADEEQAIVDLHPGAQVRDEGDTALLKQGDNWPGNYAEFRYNEDVFGKVQRVDSKLYLFPLVGGRWMVKYRLTAPAGSGAEEAERFVRALDWTIRK